MNDYDHSSQISRRNFLKLGLLAGAAAGPLGALEGVAAAERIQIRSATSLKIGLLIPQGARATAASASFVNGMQLAAAQSPAAAVQLIREQIGIGGEGAQQVIGTLTKQHGVNVLVGAMHHLVTERIQSALEESQTILVEASLGEYFPPAASHPLVFRHSLGDWRTHWAAGAWAARNAGRTAVVATSVYDYGYDGVTAFRAGFESAGGRIAEVAVAATFDAAGLATTFESIRAANPAVVYAAYSGSAAVAFVHAYRKAGINARLVAGGFAVEDDLLARHGAAADGIVSVAAWSRDLANSENAAFVPAYRAYAGEAPNAYAALGYDTARMLIAASGLAKGGLRNGLAGLRFSSLRGLATVEGQEVVTPLYLRQVAVKSRAAQATLGTAQGPASGQLTRAAGQSGWLDAYVCI